MKPITVMTFGEFQHVIEASNLRTKKLRGRPYLVELALPDHLARFETVNAIEDAAARYQAFRCIPPLELDLEAAENGLTPNERRSLAQQDRARHPRRRVNGARPEDLIAAVMQGDPWAKTAKEYWVPFSKHLKQLGLEPVLEAGSSRGEVLKFGIGSRQRDLTLGQFENYVSAIRKRQPRRKPLTASG